jgi:DNA-binding NarL/FixJ family response regulator
MTETIIIPLNKLGLDPKNVRKTYSAEGIAALAASIRADGYRLLQNLVVRKGDKKGRHFVTAGGRRRAALNLQRERQVLVHVTAGRLNKQIAGELGTVEKTIKVHRASMMRKMGVRTVADLVRLVISAEPKVDAPGLTLGPTIAVPSAAVEDAHGRDRRDRG